MGNIKISKIEPIIGETVNIGRRGDFQIFGICTESEKLPLPTDAKCGGCMLEDFPNLCKRIVCNPGERKDGKCIIIKELKK